MQSIRNLSASPCCGLCNYKFIPDESTITHQICGQRFHKKCFIPAFHICINCFSPLSLPPLKYDMEKLFEKVNQNRFNGNLQPNHLNLFRGWLSQYENNEVRLDHLLYFILNDLLSDDSPIQTALRHAAFFDILLALKALKERGASHLLEEKQFRNQCNQKELKGGFEFLRRIQDPWVDVYIEVFNQIKLHSPFPNRILEADKKHFRLRMRQTLLSGHNASYTTLMRMSEQELLALKDQPELKPMVQVHLDGQRMFRFFMHFTAWLVYSMALVILGTMLSGAKKN